MAVRFMVIDTQNLLAVRIRTNPAFGRCFYFICHHYSSAGKSTDGKAVNISCLSPGHKNLEYLYYINYKTIISLCQEIFYIY
jgi:hypothetical protein